MELNELTTISLKNNPYPFCCKISEDELICIITEHDIHILKYPLNSFNRFHHSSLRHNECVPYTNKHIDVKDLLRKVERNVVFETLNDIILIPLNSKTEPFATCSYKQTVWSPAGFVQNFRCGLATLTNFGLVEVFIPQFAQWGCILNLTTKWIDYLTEVELLKETDDVEIHKQQAYEIVTVAIEWSPTYNNNKFSFIVTAQRSNKINIWKIQSLSTNKSTNADVELIFTFDLNFHKITFLHWCKINESRALLLIGCYEGIIHCLNLNIVNEEILCSSEFSLWAENDKIKINYLTSIIKDDCVYIITAKEKFLLWFVLSHEGDILCTKTLRLGNINITGIQIYSKNELIAVCHTGHIFHIQLNNDDNNYSIIKNTIKSNLKWDNIGAYGIYISPNKSLWFLITSYVKIVDHLQLREPSQVIVCSSDQFNSEELLLKNPTKKLTNYWDCVEIMKLYLENDSEYLSKYIANQEKYDGVALYNLKIYYWIAKFCESFIRRKKNKNNVIPRADLEYILLGRHALEKLKHYISIHKKNNQLSKFQLLTIANLRYYVKKFKQSDLFNVYFTEKIAQEISNILEDSSKIQLPQKVSCLLCGEKIIDVCSSEHTMQRCIVTKVQISQVQYYTCDLCKTAIHPELDESLKLCVFCDVNMKIEYSVFS